MLVEEATYKGLVTAAVAAAAVGAVALVLIIRATPAARRTLPSLLDPPDPAEAAPSARSRAAGLVGRFLAATSLLAGILTGGWLLMTNRRVLVIEDGAGRQRSIRWMRQLGSGGEGVRVVNASSGPLEVKGTCSDPLFGTRDSWIIAPGEASEVPRVDYLGPTGPSDLMEFLQCRPGPTRYWVHWAE